MTVLAIVGSTRFADPTAWDRADWFIRQAIERLRPDKIVSGGAEGIDTRAREIAAEYGYTIDNGGFLEFLPEHRRWKPDGFEARNLQIATVCTHLLRVSCRASKTYGSGWTADQAEGMGRVVERRRL